MAAVVVDMAPMEHSEASSLPTNKIAPKPKTTHHCSSSKKIPTNKKAGLVFPIHKTARLLKDGNYAEDFDDLAPVYLATVLEYLSAELLELSGNITKEKKLTRIESRHVELAVRRDEELDDLIEKMKFWEFLPGDSDVVDDGCDYAYDDSEDAFDDDMSSEEDDDDEDLGDDEDDQVVLEKEKEEECAVVKIGQMWIATGREELYRGLIDQFGEIVSSDLSKYMVDVNCVALNKLLNVVADMIDITPETISEELVLDWEEMVEAYSGLGLKIGWLLERVQRYRNWLDTCSEKIVSQLTGKVAAKQKEVEAKRIELSNLESELQGLSTELEMAHRARSQFGFTFFDEK
ncbi:hypothetical protein ACHQM5_026275 [Ranunculus cassubicifolius]